MRNDLGDQERGSPWDRQDPSGEPAPSDLQAFRPAALQPPGGSSRTANHWIVRPGSSSSSQAVSSRRSA